jgi:hypothetical protein
MKNATPRIAVTVFKYTDICQFDLDIMQQTALEPTSISERPIHCIINRSQGTPPECNNQKMSATPKGATLTSSTSVCRSKYKFEYS